MLQGRCRGARVTQGAGEPKWSPNFTPKAQVLSLCGTGLLQQCPALVLLFSISRDASGIAACRMLQGSQGCPSQLGNFPPDFCIKGWK